MLIHRFALLLVSGTIACTGGSSEGGGGDSPADAREPVRLDAAPAPDGTPALDGAPTSDAPPAPPDAGDASPACGMAPTEPGDAIAIRAEYVQGASDGTCFSARRSGVGGLARDGVERAT